jgi:hypothetical protein
MNKKTPGNFSIDGNKLRISNSTGVSSVLFEDISSISYRTVDAPNWLYSLITFSISILLFATNSTSKNEYSPPSNAGTNQLALLLLIVSFILPYFIRSRWDNVIIETRGGMLLSYSVNEGDGINQVNKIEEEKRKITGINDGQS